MNIYIPLAVALVSFAVFYTLGLLTAKWWRGPKPPCHHQWTVLLEKYPTFTQDRWKCSECGLAENFPHDKPPIKTDLEICSMGHLHVVAEVPEWDEWPDIVAG